MCRFHCPDNGELSCAREAPGRALDAIVRELLLNHDRVEVNATDYRDRSAFSWASCNGTARAVFTFLKHEGFMSMPQVPSLGRDYFA